MKLFGTLSYHPQDWFSSSHRESFEEGEFFLNISTSSDKNLQEKENRSSRSPNTILKATTLDIVQNTQGIETGIFSKADHAGAERKVGANGRNGTRGFLATRLVSVSAICERGLQGLSSERLGTPRNGIHVLCVSGFKTCCRKVFSKRQ